MTGGSPLLTPHTSHQPFAVLFDLDGTLIDSIGLILASMEFAFEDRSRRPSTEEWVAAIGTPLDGMLRRWARDEADILHLRARYREFTLQNHDAMTTAYPGAIPPSRASATRTGSGSGLCFTVASSPMTAVKHSSMPR